MFRLEPLFTTSSHRGPKVSSLGADGRASTAVRRAAERPESDQTALTQCGVHISGHVCVAGQLLKDPHDSGRKQCGGDAFLRRAAKRLLPDTRPQTDSRQPNSKAVRVLAAQHHKRACSDVTAVRLQGADHWSCSHMMQNVNEQVYRLLVDDNQHGRIIRTSWTQTSMAQAMTDL